MLRMLVRGKTEPLKDAWIHQLGRRVRQQTVGFKPCVLKSGVVFNPIETILSGLALNRMTYPVLPRVSLYNPS